MQNIVRKKAWLQKQNTWCALLAAQKYNNTNIPSEFFFFITYKYQYFVDVRFIKSPVAVS